MSAGGTVRVVSLVPSVTETLSTWGLEPIACTRFCERPDLPHVGGTKNPDVDAIVALRPDLVVVDRQENRREDAEALRHAGVRLVTLDVCSLDGLASELATLADAVGLDIAPDSVPSAPAPLDVRAFVPIWRRPWMTIGASTYGSTLLTHIGVVNVGAGLHGDYPTVDVGWVRGTAPDLVLVPSEPYDFTDEHLAELAATAPPVRVDGRDLFWWGARTPAAVHRLHARLTAVLPEIRPGRAP